MLPNFLFIGPAKSASTWIFEILRSHPQIFVPDCKDIYFFDKFYNKGLDWYSGHFSNANRAIAVGELSHDYLFSEAACVRIGKDLPGVKLITCLRNPVDRLFSDYLFTKKHGLVHGDVFDALKQRPDILLQSLYYSPIRMYLDCFGPEKLLILDFDEIKRDSRNVTEKIYRFLGVDSSFNSPILKQVVLPASFARNKTLAFVGKKIAESMRNLGLENAVGRIKRSSLINRLLYKEYGPGEYPRLSPEDRMRLYKLLEEDIAMLEELLGASFDSWHVKSEKKSPAIA